MAVDYFLGLEFDRLSELLKPKYLETDFSAAPCISGTRVEILDDVHSWLQDYEAPNTLWILGGPGTGKTSLACSIIEHLDRSQRCASFFLFRPSLYGPEDYFPSLAYTLAGYHPLLKGTLSRLLEGDHDHFDPRKAGIQKAFEKLVLEPLRTHTPALKREGLAPVIVISSLDACYRREHAPAWESLLTALSRWSELPKDCKLIFTSCNRGDLRATFLGHHVKRIDLLTSEADHDVRKFLTRRALDIKTRDDDPDIPADWPPAEQIDKLVAHSAGYFLWAHAAMDFVANSVNAVVALDTVASAGRAHKLEEVDRVFEAVLADVFKHEKPPSGFRATVGALAVAQRPLSVSDLSALFGPRFVARAPEDVCASMAAVLTPHANDRLAIFHPSFAEYITDTERCGSAHEGFVVDATRAHLKFAVACLQLMLDGLHVDLCINAQVRAYSASDRAISYIPFPLEYACRYWASHLRYLPEQPNPELRRLLDCFLRTKLLFWIEAMSFLKATGDCARTLAAAAKWIEVRVVSKLFLIARLTAL
jgi:hypothetical protein